jgi:hypothetical protein
MHLKSKNAYASNPIYLFFVAIIMATWPRETLSECVVELDGRSFLKTQPLGFKSLLHGIKHK